MEGWVKIHRKMMDWEWFSCSKTVHLFLYLLMKASRNEHSWKGKTFQAGQLPFGRDKASLETGLSVQNIRTSLKNLELTNEITMKSSRQGTVITMVNWSKYQVNDSKLTNQLANGQPTANQRPTTTKKNKNSKNSKNIYIVSDGFKQIVEFWNEQKITTHGNLDSSIMIKASKVFDKHLKFGVSQSDIKQSILNYSKVFNSGEYWYSVKWDLLGFLGSDKTLKFYPDTFSEDAYRSYGKAALSSGESLRKTNELINNNPYR